MIKTYTGSFNSAYAQAKANGDKQFKWYNPKHKQYEVISVNVDNDKKLAEARKGATHTTVTPVKNEGVKSTGDGFDAGTLADVEVNGLYTKINRNTPGFIPINRADTHNTLEYQNALHVNPQNWWFDYPNYPRVFKNYSSGQYYITDVDGNVIGRTTDGSAEEKGFNHFLKVTNDKKELDKRAEFALAQEANKNQIYESEKNKKARESSKERSESAKRGADMLTVLGGYANMLNHPFAGVSRMVANAPLRYFFPETTPKYGMKEYISGFTPDGMVQGNNTIGAGDVLEISNPTARYLLNFYNPTAILGAVAQSVAPRVTVKQKPTTVPEVVVHSGGSKSARNVGYQYRGGFKNGTIEAKSKLGNAPQYNAQHGYSGEGYHVVPVRLTYPVMEYNPGEFKPFLWGGLKSQPVVYTTYSPEENPVVIGYTGNNGELGYYYDKGMVPAWNSDNYYQGGSGTKGQAVFFDSSSQYLPAGSGSTYGTDNQVTVQYPTVFDSAPNDKSTSHKRK